jgi:protease-4
VHDEFVRQVASLRGVEVANLASLADGSAMPGLRALEVGLVDRLGGRQVAKEEFSAILGLDTEQIVFCEYTPSTVLF